jgi:hypothetical protein
MKNFNASAVTISNIQEQLNTFELVFDDGQQVRFVEWVGEEMCNDSFIAHLRAECSELIFFENVLRQWMRQGRMTWFHDDGSFHLSFDRDLFSEDFLSSLDFD